MFGVARSTFVYAMGVVRRNEAGVLSAHPPTSFFGAASSVCASESSCVMDNVLQGPGVGVPPAAVGGAGGPDPRLAGRAALAGSLLFLCGVPLGVQ